MGKDRRFVVSRVLKPEKERAQLSLLEGSEYDYFFFVTNTTLLSEKVVIYYEKRGNAENYIKEAKYDMAVGHLLLKSFWANEAVFQMMMLSYNLFLLFKFDSLDSSEYRQQIKTFRLKYVFLAAKIIKTARYVIMKLSENYPYKGVYEKCRHCCKVSDEAAFCLIQRPYISKTLLTRRISPRGSP